MNTIQPPIQFCFLLWAWLCGCSPAFCQNQPTGRAVFAGKEVPVLCYHQVRNYTARDGKTARACTVTPAAFKAHMKMLSDSGYQTILPDDLWLWYTGGKTLPPKPVMISFDDNTASQYTTALPVLNEYRFKAVFFVMTVSLNKPGYLATGQLKALQQQGHAIGAHTWDHKNMRDYTGADWQLQIDQPLETLQGITGQPVHYFAYPYGAWTQDGLRTLQQRGIRMAFILHTAKEGGYPLLTVRRMMVGGGFTATVLHRQMQAVFDR